MHCLKFVIFTTILVYFANASKGALAEMPKLYQFDDFKQCSETYREKALYCIVNSRIKPDEDSELYRFIEVFSRNLKQSLRHDKLQRGLCMNSCEETVRQVGNDSDKYFQRKFPMDSKVSDRF